MENDDDMIKEENEYIKDPDNIKLNYDYHSYENIINTNPKLKQLDSFKTKKEYKITLNSNILNNKNQNELKRNSLTEISNNKINEININTNHDFIIKNNDNDDNNIILDKNYIQTTRNNKISSNILKTNKIDNDFKNIIKRKESLDKKLYLNDLLSDSNENKYYNIANNKKRKNSEESKDYENLEIILAKKSNKNKNNKNKSIDTIINKIPENYIITNEDLDIEEENESIQYTNKNRKNLRTYKSNPQMKTIIDNSIFIDNKNKSNKCSNFIFQNKYDELYKEYFNIKTKYEINKNNMNILQKKLKQKNHDISQMKKILISNKHQLHFLSSLKDSNFKALKDNEELINNLQTTISNLNSKIIELKNKLSQQSQIQSNYQEMKIENESLKIYLNDRDKTIATLKNSIEFLTQNLDGVLQSPNQKNQTNEKIINECEEKIKLLKEKMNQKINEFNIEKNHNLEEKLEKYINNMKELNENINSKNKEIIEIKSDNEKIKKNLEEKIKEIEDKNMQIKNLNIITEQKNKEINDIQKILEKKNAKIEFKIVKQSSFVLYSKYKTYEIDFKNNNKNSNIQKLINDKKSKNKIYTEDDNDKSDENNKIIIKKIKKHSSDLKNKNKNHFNKQIFNNMNSNSNKFRIKTNFDYFNDDNYYDNEPKKTMNSQYNINYRKYKSNKNFNTIIGNNLFINQTTTTNLNNIDIKKDNARALKLHLLNTNDEDIKKIRYTKPSNKIKKQSHNLFLSTSSMSISQNENIKSITYPEKSTSNYEYIYSLIGSDLICFNLKQKKFDIIKMNDNTKGLYTSYISYYRQNKLQPLLLNTKKIFYILMQKYIFYYDHSSNSINILTKTFSNHLNGKFIQVENSLYLISGNKNTQCELYSLITNQNNSLPCTNYPRINSGICYINDEYIYLFFGQFCENSIERLNIKNINYDEKWEIIEISEMNGINNDVIYLYKFMTFLDDYNNVIIFGGENYNNEKCSKNIYGFNLNDKSLSTIGKIDSCAKYINQYIKLDESIFSVFDENNGLHFFSKELDYHEIFNLNL